jgi:hypothetical protein
MNEGSLTSWPFSLVVEDRGGGGGEKREDFLTYSHFRLLEAGQSRDNGDE